MSVSTVMESWDFSAAMFQCHVVMPCVSEGSCVGGSRSFLVDGWWVQL